MNSNPSPHAFFLDHINGMTAMERAVFDLRLAEMMESMARATSARSPKKKARTALGSGLVR